MVKINEKTWNMREQFQKAQYNYSITKRNDCSIPLLVGVEDNIF